MSDWETTEHTRGQIVETLKAEGYPNMLLRSDSSDQTWTLWAKRSRQNEMGKAAFGGWPIPSVQDAAEMRLAWMRRVILEGWSVK